MLRVGPLQAGPLPHPPHLLHGVSAPGVDLTAGRLLLSLLTRTDYTSDGPLYHFTWTHCDVTPGVSVLRHQDDRILSIDTGVMLQEW